MCANDICCCCTLIQVSTPPASPRTQASPRRSTRHLRVGNHFGVLRWFFRMCWSGFVVILLARVELDLRFVCVFKTGCDFPCLISGLSLPSPPRSTSSTEMHRMHLNFPLVINHLVPVDRQGCLCVCYWTQRISCQWKCAPQCVAQRFPLNVTATINMSNIEYRLSNILSLAHKIINH